jgi:hypothetical protein
MPITLAWDNDDKTILRWDFEGDWNWNLVKETLGKSVAMRQTVGHDVALIFDMRDAAPLRAGALHQTAENLAAAPEGRQVLIVVGQGTFMQAMVAIFQKVYPTMKNEIKHAATLDEARALIKEIRSRT